ncbi:hypothetical protein BDV3_004083 [Batrachochytrium dendrobatidis]
MHRLQVRPVTQELQLPQLGNARPWRMNLMAVSEQDPYLMFIALHDYINCYRIVQKYQPRIQVSHVLHTHTDEPINAIRIGRLGLEEVLISADDSGQIRVFFPSNLCRTPISLSAGISAWGCATFGPSRLLAISTNAHTIRVWDMSTHLPQDSRSDQTHTTASSFELSELPSALQSPDLSRPESHTTEHHFRQYSDYQLGQGLTTRELVGHSHNVPCIDFSPCGKYIISSSIDETCRVWDISTGETTLCKKIGSEWNWTCRAIETQDIKNLLHTDPVWSAAPGSSFNPFAECNPSYQEAVPFLSRLYQTLVDNGHRVLPSNEIFDGLNWTRSTNTPLVNQQENLPTDLNPSVVEDEGDASQLNSDAEDNNIILAANENNHLMQYSSHEQSTISAQSAVQTTRSLNETVPVSTLPWRGFTQSETLNIIEYSQDILHGVMNMPRGASMQVVAAAQVQSAMHAHQQLTSALLNLESSSSESENASIHEYQANMHMGETDDGDNEWEDTSFESASEYSSDSSIRIDFNASSENTRNISVNAAGDFLDNSDMAPPTLSTEPSSSSTATFKRRKMTYSKLRKPEIDNIAPPQTFPAFMIIYTTAEDLFLLNGNTLAVECRVAKILSGWNLQRAYRGLERLSMTEWIPELSVAVVASQRGKLALVRIVRTTDDTGHIKFSMCLECWLPLHTASLAPILGMSISRHISTLDPSLTYFRLYIVTYDSKLYVYEIRSQSTHLSVF